MHHLHIVTQLMTGLQKLHAAATLAELAQMATLMVGQFVPVRLTFLPRGDRRVELVADAVAGRPMNRAERDMTELLRPHLEGMARARLDGAAMARSPQRFMAMGLTERESEILHWLAEGKSSAEAAVILVMRRRTVDKHVESILKKLGVESRIAACAEAHRRDEKEQD